MIVSVSRLHFPITSLGPGRRVGLWLQGCSLRCPGCISVDTWDPEKGQMHIRDLVAVLVAHAPLADGLTISGGEPFDQPEALATVLRAWRQVSPADVLVFSGRTYSQVKPWLADHPALIDGLVSGPFRSDLPQTLALRGSDNQQIHALTPAGSVFAAYDRLQGPSDRHLDIHFDAEGAWLAGIPARGDLGRLRRLLAGDGHQIITSDQIVAS